MYEFILGNLELIAVAGLQGLWLLWFLLVRKEPKAIGVAAILGHVEIEEEEIQMGILVDVRPSRRNK